MKFMDKKTIDILVKSGIINRKTQELAKKIVKPGKSIVDIDKQLSSYILENSAGLAWPINFSVNNDAAHNVANPEDPYILKEDDVLKVDVGVHIDGNITDSSQTLFFSKPHEKLVESSYSALSAVKKFISENYKTAKISDVGSIVDKKIREFGFKPISNLTGHCLDKYSQHVSPSIPNIPNSASQKFIDLDSHFAIEPFSSTGNGYVVDSNDVLIFSYLEDRPLRNKDAKKMLDEIKMFNGLPFSEYWVGKDLTSFSRKIALRELLKSEAIMSYPVLSDKKGSYVSQFETTFVVTKEGLIDLVKIDEI